eukprot:TRINITY_DN876_c0_g1_i1.p1 TRINITY_DN876_c0_g1~~TRINITY_DN876_c0_g1_i1.p1  ORF type:complete len:155 (-),score=37.76 TRINITY_DN876_c0_g1_i1:68-532(-)
MYPFRCPLLSSRPLCCPNPALLTSPSLICRSLSLSLSRACYSNGQAATSNRNATGDTVDNTSTPLTDSNDFPPVPPAEPAEDTGARPDYAPAAKQDGGTGGTDANNNQDNNNTAATAHDAGAGIDTDINKDNDHDDDDDNNSLTETTVTTNPAQ